MSGMSRVITKFLREVRLAAGPVQHPLQHAGRVLRRQRKPRSQGPGCLVYRSAANGVNPANGRCALPLMGSKQ